MKLLQPKNPDLPDNRPCRICGLCQSVSIKTVGGRVCLYYAVRLRDDEATDVTPASLRATCKADGNNFIWPIKGMSHKDLYDWKLQLDEMAFHRKAIKVGVWAGVMGIVTGLLTVCVEAFL